MRTTLTLDPDVARMLEEETHRQRKAWKQVVNDAIRRGLSPTLRPKGTSAYRVAPHQAALQPGIDRGALNRLSDEMEDAAVLAKRRR